MEYHEGQGEIEEDTTDSSFVTSDWDTLLFTITEKSTTGTVAGADTKRLLTQQDQFAFTCSRKLLTAWVSQPSPCCAAASVAGAMNALSLKDRDWTCWEVLEYYKTMTKARLIRQKRHLQLLTGASENEIDALEIAVSKRVVEQYKLRFGGRKKVSRATILKAARDCLLSGHHLHSPLSGLLQPKENEVATIDTASTLLGTKHSALESKISVAFEIPLTSNDQSRMRTKGEDELYQYFHLLDGLARLEHPEKPSTSICGNEAIIRAVEAINDSAAERERLGLTGNLSAILFMGKNRSQHRISTEDSDNQRLTTWRALWAQFSQEQTVLTFHLKNHYALIFALREWREKSSDSEAKTIQHRQLLTARKGQRPSTWISWDDVYETMCAWQGYKIISISMLS